MVVEVLCSKCGDNLGEERIAPPSALPLRSRLRQSGGVSEEKSFAVKGYRGSFNIISSPRIIH